MSNYLDNQLSAFKSSVSSSSAKIANKRTIAASTSRTSTPPLPPSASAADLKRKYLDQNVTYSQPQDTGTGRNIMTQVTYAVDYLKSKGTPQTLTDIVSYLSVQHRGSEFRRLLNTILTGHEKVEFEPKDDGGEGTFRFRPMHNIRSKQTLMAHLQSRQSAKGLNVHELREGWPEVEAAIDELEREGNLLVTRNKKDNHPRMVWANDPSLISHVDEEFQGIWKEVALPEPNAIIEELEKAGLTPANKSRSTKKPVKQESKKSKKPRRGGKTTNTHMAGILRDYSHLKK